MTDLTDPTPPDRRSLLEHEQESFDFDLFESLNYWRNTSKSLTDGLVKAIRRAEAAEAELRENEGVIRVWRRRTETAEAALRLVFPLAVSSPEERIIALLDIAADRPSSRAFIAAIRAAEAVIGRQDMPDWLRREVDDE